MGEAAIDPVAIRGTYVRDNIDTGLTKSLNAPSGNQGVWVGHANNNTTDAGGNDGISAWGSLAVMSAWFERNIHCGIGGDTLELAKSMNLGMRATEGIMPSLGDDLAIMHDDAAHTRIRCYASRTPTSKLEGMVHVVFVYQRCGGHENSTEA
jgi:hypothetical protein